MQTLSFAHEYQQNNVIHTVYKESIRQHLKKYLKWLHPGAQKIQKVGLKFSF